MRKAKPFWQIICILLAGAVLLIVYALYKRQHLNNHFKITQGVVTKISSSSSKGNSRRVAYEFYLNGTKYTGHGRAKKCRAYRREDLTRLLVNRKFFIAYDSTDPGYSVIILRKKDAVRFSQPVTATILHYDSIVNCKRVSADY